jgi:uncharacterized membrane protein
MAIYSIVSLFSLSLYLYYGMGRSIKLRTTLWYPKTWE